MSASRSVIVDYLNAYLKISEIQDRSSNGLQLQGASEVQKIGLAVDACLEAYKKAVEQKCQMLIVHHGFIWGGGLTSITGGLATQIRYAMQSDLNVYGAHLPLDAHAVCGNNIVLAKMLGLFDIKPFGLYRNTLIGYHGILEQPLSSEEIGSAIQAKIGGKYSILPFGKAVNRHIAIVSGGGTDALDEAIDLGADCFLTGEGNHANHHKALEAGINMVYSGHYETETVGVKALGGILEKQFDVKTVFLDVPTLI